MISKKEVQHIAKLARLDLTEKEIGRFQKELHSILDYVGKLKEIDEEISHLKPTKHSLEAGNIMREDKAHLSVKSEKLLESAPQTEKGYLKVKSILK